MANGFEVSFTAWVNGIEEGKFGPVLKVTYDQRKKNQQTGEWETADKYWIDVTGDAGILKQFANSRRVIVDGLLTKFDVYTKKDGSLGRGIRVWAQNISSVDEQAPRERVIDQDDAAKYGMPF